MAKKKVLFIQEELSLYSIPTFNKIAELFDLTLMYSKGGSKEESNFNCFENQIRKVGPFFCYDVPLKRIFKDYDIIICSPNFQFLNILFETLLRCRKKTIYYGIGVTASYNHGFDSNKLIPIIFSLYIRKIGAAVFYTYYPIHIYERLGIKKNKLFVANNTVKVLGTSQNNISIDEKNNLLFIGTLYRQKGILELLNSYKIASDKEKNMYDLYIIGQGPEEKEIRSFVCESGLETKVHLLGPIYDENTLKKYFDKSLLCISPNQAGLSVLKSMGYGVPFVTKENAITGGEILNITNKKNGIVYKSSEELEEILLDAYTDREKYLSMGIEAKKYYESNATIDIMAKGFINAIEYVANHK